MVGLACPLTQGSFDRVRTMNFPSKYPAGDYHIVAKGVTANGKPISHWELDLTVVD